MIVPTWEYKQVGPFQRVTGGGNLPYTDDQLNQLGAEGWELWVCNNQFTPSGQAWEVFYIFRRQTGEKTI